MKYSQFSNNLGEYTPAFFQMYLDVDARIDLNSCTDGEFALFFHEYIHFLQDLTTTYGLTQCFYYGEYIQYAVNDIYKKKKGEINVPIQYVEPSHPSHIQSVISNVTMGDCSSVSSSFSVVNAELEILDELPIDNSKIGGISVVNIETDDGFVYSFGAYAIKESIAYILERQVTRDYKPSPKYPYCSAELLAKYVFPAFGENMLNVLALSDISLMFSNPAEVFYKTLLQLKKKNFIPSKPHDLYAQLKNAKVKIGDMETDPFSHFEMVAVEARNKFKSYFYSDDQKDVFQSYQEWIDRLFDFTIHMRKNEPSFLLNLYYDGYVGHNNTFIRLVKNLGSPLIRNKRQDYFCIKPSGISGWTNEVMKTVFQLYELFHNGIIPCKLFPWCRNSDSALQSQSDFVPINPTPEICLHKPWKRCDCDELCPFALLWKNWNLVGYVPKLRE